MTRDASLSILGCADWPLGAPILRGGAKATPAALERLRWPVSTGGNPRRLMNGGPCGRLSR